MSDTTVEARWESHNEAGRRHFSEGDYAAAEQEFTEAIREATLLGAANVRLASSLSNLGQLKYRQKDLAQAETLFRRSLSIREGVMGKDHFSLVQAINNLAALHYARGELDEAAKYFSRALAICDGNLDEKHPDVVVTLNNLARLHFRRNDYAAAAPLLMRLLSIKQESVGAHHPEVAVILTSLAKVRLAEGQLEDAEQLARRALVIREGIHQSGDPAIATSIETLAEIMAARGLREEEQGLLSRARAIRARASGETGGGGLGGVVAASPAVPAPRARHEEQSPASLATQAPHAPVSVAPLAPAAAAPAAVVGAASDATVATAAPEARIAAASEALSVIAPGAPTPGHDANAPEAPPLGHEAQPEAPAPPARTTRSASLPWIEPPTSPALRRPAGSAIPQFAAHATTGPTSPTATSGAANRSSTVAASHRVTGSGAAQVSVVRSGPISNGPRPIRRELVMEPLPARSSRPWLTILAAAAVLGMAAGGWAYYAGGSRPSELGSAASSGLAPVSPSSDEASTSATPAGAAALRDERASGASFADASPADGPGSARDPYIRASMAQTEAGYEAGDPPAAAGGDDRSARAEPRALELHSTRQVQMPVSSPVHTTAAGEMAVAPSDSTPSLPRINVDRITSAIGANARARADSIGRTTMTVKEPVFDQRHP